MSLPFIKIPESRHLAMIGTNKQAPCHPGLNPAFIHTVKVLKNSTDWIMISRSQYRKI